MDQDVPNNPAVPGRMPGVDMRPVHQMWDVHWSIVKQHMDAVRAAAAANSDSTSSASS
tara:strand:+ start:325 stop:498 length:174 start_codon:yes stop_codon:yes gene_type:complete